MNEFTSSKLIRTLHEASQTGIDCNIEVLKTEYDEFAMYIFTKCDTSSGMVPYRNSLVYTRMELKSLTAVPGKKHSCLS